MIAPTFDAYVRACRSCDAPIIWARTVTGQTMPVDAEPVNGGNVLLELRQGLVRATVLPPGPASAGAAGESRQSHFVTCPHANAWRRRNP